MHREQTGHTAALLIFAAHQMARPFRRNHKNIYPGRRHDPFEMNVETMTESEIIAILEARLNFLLVSVALQFVRQQDHDDVSRGSGSRCIRDLEAGGGGFWP